MHGTHQLIFPTRRVHLCVVLPILCCAVASLGMRAHAPRPPSSSTIAWVHAIDNDEIEASWRWRAAVGSPVYVARPTSAVQTGDGETVVVCWNTHVGGGDVERLVSDLRSGRITRRAPAAIVLLLQEVYRAGDDVPESVADGARAAGREAPARPDGTREGITETARRLGMSLIYAPSMRNGSPREDRGNAILATVPLSDPFAIELPLERQRRVAIGASLALPGHGQVRVISTHFTNMVAHHLWIFAEAGRVRQARALRKALPDGPLVLGGDLNAWFGYRDAAYRELAAALPGPRPADRRATFGPMRLDHLFFRIDSSTPAVRRLDDRYGSDHYPLVAEVR